MASSGVQMMINLNACLLFQIDILCDDQLLGKDHTLKFVFVTRWRFKQPPLKLTYRPRIELIWWRMSMVHWYRFVLSTIALICIYLCLSTNGPVFATLSLPCLLVCVLHYFITTAPSLSMSLESICLMCALEETLNAEWSQSTCSPEETEETEYKTCARDITSQSLFSSVYIVSSE